MQRRDIVAGANRFVRLSLVQDAGGCTIWIAFESDGRLLARSFLRPQFAGAVADALRALARESER